MSTEASVVEDFLAVVRRVGAVLHSTAPMELAETMVALEVQLGEYAEALNERARAAAEAEAERVLAAGAQIPPDITDPEPVRVPIAIEPDAQRGAKVVAKSPAAEAPARTLQKVVDLMARHPLGTMATTALEVAAHVEALEMENAALRAEVARWKMASEHDRRMAGLAACGADIS